jgi:hypothetical protein
MIDSVFSLAWVLNETVQPSQGLDVESEYEDEAMEEDGLLSEEEEQVRWRCASRRGLTHCENSRNHVPSPSKQRRIRRSTDKRSGRREKQMKII